MSNYYIFPVGDWSGDGHAYVAEFLVKGDKSLQEIRETQFSNDWIANICKDYDENYINLDILENFNNKEKAKLFLKELIQKHNLKIEVFYKKEIEVDELFNEMNEPEDVEIFLDYNSLVELWVYALNDANPELSLEVASEAMSKYYIKYKGYPVKKEEIVGYICFSGFDEKGRHLESPGYGVWKDIEDEEFNLGCN